MEVMTLDNYKNRDLLDVVIQKKEEQQKQFQIAESIRNANLNQRQNGNLSRPSSFVSKRSTAVSQSQDQDSELNVGQTEELNLHGTTEEANVKVTLNGIGFLWISAVILVSLDLQILLNLTSISGGSPVRNDSFLTSQKQYDDIIEVTTAFATFVFILQTNCLLLCSMQFFFVTKISKVTDGYQRANKYLSDCSSSRFIAVVGYFVSIPAFIITVMLYILLGMQYTPAVTSIVILSIGTVFGFVCMIQNIYHWHVEISRANDGLPVYDKTSKAKLQGLDNFNTLV